ncbi:MAG: phosphoribosylamine--glycine ligase [Legionella sp.]|nr:MAG: phosphoribosylamine--glycine ligase [Legionella sp.]
MKILIVGSGAREHSIAKTLAKSIHQPLLYCCGTSLNPGIKTLCQDYWVGEVTDNEKVSVCAQDWQVDWAFIGPEAPLEKGLADALWALNIPVIGPKKQLAQIETSKAFTRELMQKYNIAGLPVYKVFNDLQGVAEFLEHLGEGQYVIKANGLMAGKGVKVAGEHLHSFSEALAFCEEILQSQHSFVIEEKLLGQEFSFMCFTDGKNLAPMPIVQDHKRAFVGDTGPNTGGMGSYSNADHSLPFLKPTDVAEAFAIHQQVLQALKTETQERYLGILYGGFMVTAKGVYVIEFNARFGDPEALNVLSLLESDLVDLCLCLIQEELQPESVRFAPQATVCKYAVPLGYPNNPLKNSEIHIDAIKNPEQLYLAAVHAEKDKLYATGSRTAAVVGIAASIEAAEAQAEQEIQNIHGPLFHREDIGTSLLIQSRVDMMRKLRSE